ncbi:cobalt/nickel transport system permease protein [Candidatus Magnetomoraceae bacterium gMMP-15]
MIPEPFSTGNSLLHRLNPCVKIVIACLFSLVIALSTQFTCLGLSIGLSFILILLARLDLKSVFYRLLIVNGLTFFLWFVLPFTIKGEPVFSIASLIASKQGLILSLQITLKTNAILLALIAMIATSSTVSLGHAANCLYLPDKIVYLFLFTYRYIFIIENEYKRLLNAAKIRGFQPKTNVHTYKTYAYLMGMLLVKSFDRAEQVYKAMICRGFKGKFYSLHEFSISRIDWIFGIFMSVAVIALVFI